MILHAIYNPTIRCRSQTYEETFCMRPKSVIADSMLAPAVP